MTSNSIRAERAWLVKPRPAALSTTKASAEMTTRSALPTSKPYLVKKRIAKLLRSPLRVMAMDRLVNAAEKEANNIMDTTDESEGIVSSDTCCIRTGLCTIRLM